MLITRNNYECASKTESRKKTDRQTDKTRVDLLKTDRQNWGTEKIHPNRCTNHNKTERWTITDKIRKKGRKTDIKKEKRHRHKKKERHKNTDRQKERNSSR